MEKIAEFLKEYDEITNKLEKLEELQKELKKRLSIIETDLVGIANSNMIDRIKIEDREYSFSYERRIYVKETAKDHSKKVELYKILSELGYDEAVFFESAYYPANSLKKIWKKLPIETINKFQENGLIYYEVKPKIEVKKIKK